MTTSLFAPLYTSVCLKFTISCNSIYVEHLFWFPNKHCALCVYGNDGKDSGLFVAKVLHSSIRYKVVWIYLLMYTCFVCVFVSLYFVYLPNKFTLCHFRCVNLFVFFFLCVVRCCFEFNVKLIELLVCKKKILIT